MDSDDLHSGFCSCIAVLTTLRLRQVSLRSTLARHDITLIEMLRQIILKFHAHPAFTALSYSKKRPCLASMNDAVANDSTMRLRTDFVLPTCRNFRTAPFIVSRSRNGMPGTSTISKYATGVCRASLPRLILSTMLQLDLLLLLVVLQLYRLLLLFLAVAWSPWWST